MPVDVQIPELVRSDLIARWTEPHRRHHDRRHLVEVLAALDRLSDAGLRFDARPVVLAAWFHDAVYDPTAGDNEGASADLARALLSEDPDRDEVARLVESTREHRPNAPANTSSRRCRGGSSGRSRRGRICDVKCRV